MRDIKFRGWDEVTKIMHYPKTDMMWDVAHIISSYEPIMQFTGLKDKNGKEIYESDIISNGKARFTVDWNEAKCAFILFGHGRENKMLYELAEVIENNYEVIGNIYE